ncbi:adenylate kinase [Anaerotalea alkaliphila]|uniref:Adenylate kinase n=1 Tax=Anaerotalea alkaliphila TaxID=2662126 RepID=A0A7X5HY89_9FIRM|nr:adenylate kinase [Anaerotalea alkaliphila]NDL68811.1 adenylate kinase [Anaerotalea alkaliphila]
MRIVLLGAPGAGKGTLAKEIVRRYQIPHISTGDIFRENIRNGTELGEKVKGYMEQGQLVPDALVVDLVGDRIAQRDCLKGYVLDGFPRTRQQAEALDCLLCEREEKIDRVIELEVAEETILRRMSDRRVCADCGAVWNLSSNPPQTENVCDQCGNALEQREDDKEETVLRRLEVYRVQTSPLVEYYDGQGILATINGDMPVAEVAESIIGILE